MVQKSTYGHCLERWKCNHNTNNKCRKAYYKELINGDVKLLKRDRALSKKRTGRQMLEGVITCC